VAETGLTRPATARESTKDNGPGWRVVRNRKENRDEMGLG
jgi:hypothetical protein